MDNLTFYHDRNDIIVGVDKSEGQAVLPPSGLSQNKIDKLQGDVLNLANQISPHYYPLIQPYVLEKKHILVLWCPAGDNRPYTAPSTLGGKAQRYPYIRYGSRSIIAKNENLRRYYHISWSLKNLS